MHSKITGVSLINNPHNFVVIFYRMIDKAISRVTIYHNPSQASTVRITRFFKTYMSNFPCRVALYHDGWSVSA